jgi:O-acetyl-ADP-ribose deacetylase (regulator of RNase III)
MLEAKADLWEYPAEYRVITTNGFVKDDGKAVMGRGCAKEAAKKYPRLPKWLGIVLLNHGNHVHLFPDSIISFPVKHNWWEEADTKLIARSTIELVDLVDRIGARSVVMPRPGCGNGKLDWRVVRLILRPYLDDRFTVVSFEKEE